MKAGWVVVAVAVIFLGLAGGVALSVYLSLQAVHTGDRRWCDTLTLLTARPVAKPADPAANPSRQASYVFYTDVVKLRREFGCQEAPNG